MIIAAMSFGPSSELLFFALDILLSLGILLVLGILKMHFKSITWLCIAKTILLVPTFICLTIVAHEFVTSPMKVTKWRLQGTYVINTEIFKGENTNWQYDHYWLKIKDDVLYLNVMKEGKLIKQFKKAIEYKTIGKHVFINFDDNKSTQVECRDVMGDAYFTIVPGRFELWNHDGSYNSTNHHMLKRYPLLHADPFNFNIVLQSEKYGNMFFTKGRWKNVHKQKKVSNVSICFNSHK